MTTDARARAFSRIAVVLLAVTPLLYPLWPTAALATSALALAAVAEALRLMWMSR